MTLASQNQPSKRAFHLQGLLFVAAVFIGPALLLWHLHRQWNPDGEYAYAWVVPMLAAFLLKSRWNDRPTPSAPILHAALLTLLLALLVLPTRWLHEAAPERGICAWSHALACIGTSLCLLSFAGGSSWLRWFSFPFFFLFTTVPWPHTLERFVSDPLMLGTAGTTVEALCLIGIPSLQSGHLVHIETGVLDISEACSGVRSLQAMVMVALFLGELFRFRPTGRILLMVIALSTTLLANVLRTTVLAVIGSDQGIRAVDSYHDMAGFSVLAFSLLSTLAAACLLRPARTAVAAPVPETPASGFIFPFKLSAALLLWFCLSEISVETWYRWHEPRWQGWSWSLQWPGNVDDFHIKEIPRRSLQRLLCDESQSATWKEADGSDWTFYSLRWNPGNPAAEAAKVHRPDVCLTAQGACMQKDLGVTMITVGRMQIPFHSYIFRLSEKFIYVFFCTGEERPGEPVVWDPQFEAVDISQRALKGWRNSAVQSLEVAVTGYSSESAVLDAFKARLEHLLLPGENASSAATK